MGRFKGDCQVPTDLAKVLMTEIPDSAYLDKGGCRGGSKFPLLGRLGAEGGEAPR